MGFQVFKSGKYLLRVHGSAEAGFAMFWPIIDVFLRSLAGGGDVYSDHETRLLTGSNENLFGVQVFIQLFLDEGGLM